MGKKHKGSSQQKPSAAAPTVEIKSETESMVYSKNRSYFILGSLLLLILCAALYSKVGDFGYVLDDQIVITDNSFTKKGLSGIYELLTTESMTGYFGEQKNLVQGNRYRPLSLITFAIEYEALDGLNPRVSHWINVLLYWLSALVLFRLFTLLFSSRSLPGNLTKITALGIAILFVVHPIHVEAVANIKGRDEIMALLFSLLSLLYAFKYHQDRSKLHLILAAIAFLLGLLSKENTITFLAVIPLTIYFFSNSSLKKSLFAVLPFLITAALYLVLRFQVSGVPQLGQVSDDLMNNPFAEMTGVQKYATIFYTLLLYIKLLIFPYPLTHDYYPYTIPKMDFGDYEVWLAIVLYGALIFAGLRGLKKKQLLSYGLLFYLTTLTIVSNTLINLGTFMNDRFIYMPSIGFFIVLSAVFLKFAGPGTDKKKLGIAGLIFFLVVAAYSAGSYLRVPAWESALTLNQSAIKVSKNSARANCFMSTALFDKARTITDPSEKKSLLLAALPYARRSVEIFPTYYNGNLMYVGITAELHKLDNNLDNFIAEFEPVMKVRPDIPFITEYLQYLNGRVPEQAKLNAMYNRVGRALLTANTKNNLKWALHYLNMAYTNDPSNKQTLQAIAEAYTLLGDVNTANKFFNMMK